MPLGKIRLELLLWQTSISLKQGGARAFAGLRLVWRLPRAACKVTYQSLTLSGSPTCPHEGKYAGSIF
jgi:hypothetical protein